MPERWRVRGEYLENCNCEVLCPCLLGPRDARGGAAARPTEGVCNVPVVFRVDEGTYGATSLDGTHAVAVVSTPGPMGAGGWTFGLYVDAAAGEAQRHALEAIFGGNAGGVMARVTTLVATRLPTRVAPIEFGLEGRRRWARIPGVLDIDLDGIEGRDGPRSEVWLDNVRHFVGRRLAAARATRGGFRDHGYDWDHAGRNGHYAPFDWSGP